MKKILFSLSFIAVLIACSSSEDSAPTDPNSPTRKAMLENWADNIIIPAFQNYQTKINTLATATATFSTTANQTNFDNVRTAWLEAYKAYQQVALFEIGKAEEPGLMLRFYANTYPTQVGPNNASGDLNGIDQNIASGTYDLTVISSADEQGFPALDYLLYGLGADSPTILAFYTSNPNATNYKNYLTAVVTRLKTVTDTITNNWTSGYRNTFVSSDGTGVNSSVSRMVNVFVNNYETAIRKGKIGIPAGEYSVEVRPQDVEAFYKKDISKILLEIATKSSNDFFVGKHFATATQGSSIKSYLDYLNIKTTVSGSEVNMSSAITTKFTEIDQTIVSLNNSFTPEVPADKTNMGITFDKFQETVSVLKNQMMPALQITVDYQDGDND